jgi:hypothetical protein
LFLPEPASNNNHPNLHLPSSWDLQVWATVPSHYCFNRELFFKEQYS